MAVNVLTTYSAKDLNMSFAHPYIALISAAGIDGKGLVRVVVRPLVEQTAMDICADGAVAVSAIPGDTAEIDVVIKQTSTLQAEFLAWYNAIRAAELQGDVSMWAAATMVLLNIVDGSSHYARGVCPKKVPDKTYDKQAGDITWTFMAAVCTHE